RMQVPFASSGLRGLSPRPTKRSCSHVRGRRGAPASGRHRRSTPDASPAVSVRRACARVPACGLRHRRGLRLPTPRVNRNARRSLHELIRPPSSGRPHRRRVPPSRATAQRLSARCGHEFPAYVPGNSALDYPMKCLWSYNSMMPRKSAPIMRSNPDVTAWGSLTKAQAGPASVASGTPTRETLSMEMFNTHCGIDRDTRGVVRLTICNAGSLNILGSGVINGLREGFERLAGDRGIRVLVLAGQSDRSLIGGADIKEMARLDQKSAEAFITRLRDLCESIRAFPAPVIARMPGWCLGGGLEVAAACDFRVAAHDASFGMPEVRVGIPSVIHAALLPRLIGWGRARWLVMTAENIDAPTALAWGLIDKVAPKAGLDAAVERTVEALLECGPEALRSQKALLRQWEELPLRESVDLSIGVFGKSFLTDE